MKTKSFCLSVQTQDAPEFIDITGWVSECVADSNVSNGFAVVYSKHTTAAVKINENEPLLLADMAAFLEKKRPPPRPLSAQRFRHPHRQYDPRRISQRPRPLAAPIARHQRNRADPQRRNAVRRLPEHLFHRTGPPPPPASDGPGGRRIAPAPCPAGRSRRRPPGAPNVPVYI